jgi:hypothetical protein
VDIPNDFHSNASKYEFRIWEKNLDGFMSHHYIVDSLS